MEDRIILHLDMNSYFASCEQQANPHLRGRPVGVCEHLGGIIIAPSVEAKRLGIKLGTTVWDARKIYPKIVLLPVDPDKYRHVTASFLKILYDYSDRVEKYSIDEAFVDITELCYGDLSLLPSPSPGEGNQRAWDNALMIGLEIKQRIRQEIGEWVSCSIGIGPNKLLAKIGADLGEGDIDRIFVIKPQDIDLLYERLSLTDVPGIGPRFKHALHKLGIFTLRQLRDYPVNNLINQFGINGYFLHDLARFNFSPHVARPFMGYAHRLPINRHATNPHFIFPSRGREIESIKSFGHSYTLSKPIHKLSDIKKLMLKLSEKIGRRMRRKGARGNMIHYFHSDKRYESFSKQHKIKEFINDGREIYRAAWGIFLRNCHSESPEGRRRIWTKNPDPSPPFDGLRAVQDDKIIINPIKIMGITVSGLIFDKPQEPLLEIYKKAKWLVSAMDKINDKYGEFTIKRGRLAGVDEEWGKDTVGFGRMKEFNL